MNFGDDIALQLRTARKKRFNQIEERRIAQEIELQSYLNKLIFEDKVRRVQEVQCDENEQENIAEKTQEIENQCVCRQILI